MSYSASSPINATAYCATCNRALMPGVRFCAGCGSAVGQAQPSYDFAANGTTHRAHAPSFAPLSAKHFAAPDPKLQTEAGKIMLLLARERLFLYMHWAIALTVQGIGCWIAYQCYTGYIGDDLTRLMMASTPFLYINSTGLICIVPIRGCRKEIARLKEKLNLIRFQIEYNHLL